MKTPATAPRDPAQRDVSRPVTIAEIQRLLRGPHLGPVTVPVSGMRREPVPVPIVGDATETVVVINAHAGAGSSTVALALADEAAGTRTVQVIEWCHPSRSGLAAASTRELGEASPGWLRGTRGPSLVIDRPNGLHLDLRPDIAGDLRLVDVSDPLATVDSARTVLVCRLSVPGLLSAEAALDRLPSVAALVVVGGRRWPRPMSRSAGRNVDALHRKGRVVFMPFSRRLARTGPTPDRLPPALRSAARTLLDAVTSPSHLSTVVATNTSRESADER